MKIKIVVIPFAVQCVREINTLSRLEDHVFNHREMQSRWTAWPHAPQATLYPEDDEGSERG
jgi:hypothetical protein